MGPGQQWTQRLEAALYETSVQKGPHRSAPCPYTAVLQYRCTPIPLYSNTAVLQYRQKANGQHALKMTPSMQTGARHTVAAECPGPQTDATDRGRQLDAVGTGCTGQHMTPTCWGLRTNAPPPGPSLMRRMSPQQAPKRHAGQGQRGSRIKPQRQGDRGKGQPSHTYETYVSTS